MKAPRLHILLPVCGAMLLIAQPLAATPAKAQPPAATGPADTGPESGDPEARRKALNLEQARLARKWQETSTASRKAHDAAASRAKMQRLRDNAAYSAALAAHQKAEDQYRTDYAAWEKTAAACKRGDRKLCPSPKRK
ncbi:hypothetical protein [Novosphingobium beihaiensis]|uniref:Uncharacterized protein n=1 Tax=Novosphingobium beihaiensis TaxID=2930389 RepID=A0ABT0BUP3_9SPHN|nr:hypothetical protein [Novosphingobium beihaiensis]MCJ2188780.1 hypothetical protein [Novosphingobium beihaiensis]